MKKLSWLLLFMACGAYAAQSKHLIQGERAQKKLNFDGSYVESLGPNLDSMTQINEGKRKHVVHLYKKRSDFEPETAETFQQVRYN